MAIKWDYNKVKECIEKEGYYLLSDTYKNNRDKLKVMCLYGHKYMVNWDNFYNKKSRCPYCYGRYLTYEQVKSYIEETGSKLISDTYVNAHTHLNVKCKCGNIYPITWNNYKRGKRCPKCCHNRKIDINYVKDFALNEGYEVLSSEYINAYERLAFRCNKGHNFNIPWCYFQSGTRCLYCRNSKGEEKVAHFLNKSSIKNIPQHTFDDCFYNKKGLLRFDFYLPELNTIIEYDGKQHFEPVDFAGKGIKWAEKQFIKCVERDKIKNQYCKDNSIKLIRIPYWDINNIDDILLKELNL